MEQHNCDESQTFFKIHAERSQNCHHFCKTLSQQKHVVLQSTAPLQLKRFKVGSKMAIAASAPVLPKQKKQCCKIAWFTDAPCIMPGICSWKTVHKSKSHKSNTKFPLNTVYFLWGLGDWQPHPIYCMTIPLVDIWTCRVYMCCIYKIFLYNIVIHFQCNKNVNNSRPLFLVWFILIGLQ